MTAVNPPDLADLASILDLDKAPSPGETVVVAPRLTLGNSLVPGIHNVIDGGTVGGSRPDGNVILVTTNHSLSVRRAEESAAVADGPVVVVDSSLGVHLDDIKDIVELPDFVEVPISRIAARSVHEATLAGIRSERVLGAIGELLVLMM